MTAETLIVVLIVASAVGYLFWLIRTKAKSGGCGTSGCCGSAPKISVPEKITK